MRRPAILAGILGATLALAFSLLIPAAGTSWVRPLLAVVAAGLAAALGVTLAGWRAAPWPGRLALSIEASRAAFREFGLAEGDGCLQRPLWTEMLGYRPDEVPADDAFLPWLLRHVEPADRDALARTYADFTSGLRPDVTLEVRARHRRGHRLHVRCRLQSIRAGDDGSGIESRPVGPTHVLGVMLDVTDQKRLEEELSRQVAARTTELQERQETLAGVVNNAADAIITIDAVGRIESANPAVERTFGYTFEELRGRNVSMLMPPPYCDEHDSYLSQYRRTGRKRVIGVGRELVGRRKDGSTFPLELAVTESHHGTGVRFTGILRDISGRRNLEKQVLEVVAREQRRIGQDLHDGIGQELLGLCLLSEGLAESLAQRDDPGRELAAKITARLRECLAQVRALSRGLVPVEIDADGLMAALATLASRSDELGAVRCIFDCPEPIPVADNTTATHLYRIAQEAVSNALKHAGAGRVEISFRREGEMKVLCVRDDGGGIDGRSDEGKGMGMPLMRYRAGLIGGQLSFSKPESGRGTVVICALPRETEHVPT